MGDVNNDVLPTFRYHPDPRATGSVEPRGGACVVCGRARGFTYVGPVYASAEVDERLCPWCIADGGAARKLGAEFTDAGFDVPDDVPEAVLKELSQRTPGFLGWQQEHWLYHCGDAAAFLGRVGWQELQDYPDALEVLRHEHDGLEWSGGEVDEYIAGLDKNGGSTAYLFRCLGCGTHLAYSDFE